MSEQMTVTYGGVVVAYVEKDNKWKFTLRGRDRSAESLAAAKAAIDKPTPADKAKPFERIPAFKGGPYDSDFKQGEVTSIAEQGYRSSVMVWFSSKEGRSKESVNSLYADTKENREIMAQIDAMREQSAVLNKKAQQRCQDLAKLVIEVPE